jgi:hypothetical protein
MSAHLMVDNNLQAYVHIHDTHLELAYFDLMSSPLVSYTWLLFHSNLYGLTSYDIGLQHLLLAIFHTCRVGSKAFFKYHIQTIIPEILFIFSHPLVLLWFSDRTKSIQQCDRRGTKWRWSATPFGRPVAQATSARFDCGDWWAPARCSSWDDHMIHIQHPIQPQPIPE